MAIDSGFDYDRLLTLDQAKLVGRTRINNLGSYELTLNYNKITSSTKEDCLEWLEANRLDITDPTFSNKTYEGEWKCVSIAYDENKSIIQQIFKIDSSVGDLGDWDGNPPEPTDLEWAAQSGDLSRISDGMRIEKAYYWKITNPESVNLPSSEIKGEIWTKNANDNGDGTYDVTVSREVAKDQLSQNETETFAYTETTDLRTNNPAEEELPTPVVGFTASVTNTPLENGNYRTTSTLRESQNQSATSYNKVGGETSDGTAEDSIFVYQADDALANGEYTFTSGVGPPDFRNGAQAVADTRVWTNANSYTIDYTTKTKWSILTAASAIVYDKVALNLNSFGWKDSGGLTAFIIVQVGINKPLYEEDIALDTSESEASFVSDGGSIPDPEIGQEVTIRNTPNPDGTFNVTVTTRTMNFQRIPAMEDSIIFGGDSDIINEDDEDRDRNAFIWARNATYEQYQFDINYTTNNKNQLSNMMSASINKWGLYDYTIRSMEV